MTPPEAENHPHNPALVHELMTEEELIVFLRIPELSQSKKYRNVIAHLKRFRGLPCIYICRKPLYPLDAIKHWISQKVKSS